MTNGARSHHFYMTIERPGVAYDLRGGAGSKENSGVDKNHHDFHCCLRLLPAERHPHPELRGEADEAPEGADRKQPESSHVKRASRGQASPQS